MNRMPPQNRKRRNIVSDMIGWDSVSNSLEQRIVPAYVSGDFGWASSFETTQLYANNIIQSSAVNSQGDVYQLGSFTGTVDFDTSVGTYNISSTGNSDAFILKLDSNGRLVWVKTITGAGNACATSIRLDSSENLIITGWYTGTADFDPSTASNFMTSSGAEDVFVIKLDSSGNALKSTSIGGLGSDQ